MKAEPSESVLFTAQRGATRRCFVNEVMTKAPCSSVGCHSQPEEQSNFIIIFAQKLLSGICPSTRNLQRFYLLWSLVVLCGAAASGAETGSVPPPTVTEHKENVSAGGNTPEAMRLLKANCFSCHNEKKKKGGLVMTSREALLQGGESGTALKVGIPEQSLLMESLAPGADPHMPPNPTSRIRGRNRVFWAQSGM